MLIAIDHGNAILHRDIGIGRLLCTALTVLVPYAVSTVSSVGAILGGAATVLDPRNQS